MNIPIRTLAWPLFWTLLAFVLLPGASRVAQAAEMQGLYQSEVAVASRDDERERTRAFVSGIETVLLKLTGRADTLENPVIRRQIQNPQTLVEGWAYQTRSVVGEAPQLYLQINYFQPQVQRMLDEAGVPLWPASRPETLLWVVTQDELGTRALADPTQDEEALYTVLREQSQRRALPLRLPLMDLEDRLNLNADQAWSVDQDALHAASERYDTESILVLRLFRTLSGETLGKATYLLRDRALEYESLEAPEPEFLEGAVNLVATELASTFSVRLSGVDNSTRARLNVSGVHSLDDYAAIMRYLDELAVISSVQVLAVDGESLSVEVRTGGQLRQLVETLAIERRLQQQSEPVREGQNFLVQYQWLGAR
ncbi:MAG TPA: DUF2066 domain-containing protein [Hyphomicrobiales bacterium]|nr:DUF2066 domain-containing protein [Hyphomicrobiales bacterium]